MTKLICAFLMVVGIIGLSGCGSSEPTVDTIPFEKAVSTFLSAKQMDMKVSKFKEINVEGDKATAKCAMKAVAGPNITVSWSFTFEKKDGAWIVTDYKQK